MSATPEGKVKTKIRKLLSSYDKLYQFWPVPSGYGASSLDCIVCFFGDFIAIEAKAEGNDPTPRQAKTISDICSAGGIAFVIAGDDDLAQLKAHLDLIWLTRCKR